MIIIWLIFCFSEINKRALNFFANCEHGLQEINVFTLFNGYIYGKVTLNLTFKAYITVRTITSPVCFKTINMISGVPNQFVKNCFVIHFLFLGVILPQEGRKAFADLFINNFIQFYVSILWNYPVVLLTTLIFV